jgi:hypothetical protein
MDEKFMAAMKHYYKLKEQYDTILYKQRQKIMSSNLSKKDKRDRYIRTVKKCINCKKPGGTIFTNINGRLKAVCGSAEQCNLNIELFKSRFMNSQEEVRFYLKDLNQYKTRIIMTKLDFLFGYKSEDETVSTFEKSRLEIAKITDKIYQIENDINSKILTNNKENIKNIKILNEALYNDINTLKKLYADYLKDSKIELIKDMVEVYLAKIKPEAEEIRNLTYMYTGIENDEGIYRLIEEPYTIDKMEIPDEKSVVVSYTF